jgi:asparagine synthase (glutamine-hydrolysing)
VEVVGLPGLFGVITKRPPDEAKAEIDRMLDCVSYESFYTSGSFAMEPQGLYIGWAVQQGSFSECMPIIDSAHNRTMFFSGQNFPNEHLVGALRSGGHTPNFTHASYLLDAYDLNEAAFFSSLNGWFCGVIADVESGVVHLFNDRYGVGRLYIYEAPDGFYFASEAKALLRVRKELRRLDPQGMGEFFACDCALENRTLFSNLFLLPGGSLWTFQGGSLTRKGSYFTPEEWENQEPLSRDCFLEEMDSTFARLLPRYSHFRKPTAISLTGGLDTRMIFAYLAGRPGEFPCYTFGGIGKDTFDVSIARSVAKACGQPHTTVKLGPEFLADFPRYAERTVYISDGCHDVCGTHDVYFNAIAREISPARLTGKFGSEVLRRTRQLWARPPAQDLFEPAFRPYVNDTVSTMASMDVLNEVSFAAFVEIPWHEYGRLAVEQSQVTFITPYMDNDLVRLMYRGRDAVAVGGADNPVRSIQKRRPELLDILTDRGYRGGGFTSWISRHFYQTLLFKWDWFFHYMPHRYAKLGAFLERLHVQDLFLGRHIMTNYRAWFQQDLSDYLRDMLLDPNARVREYIDGPVLERMVHSHIKGERCYLGEINKALTAELIHRQLIEGLSD